MGICELAYRAEAGTGEGALWDDRLRRLYWVDIPNGEIHCFDPSAGADTLVAKAGQPVGTVVQREGGGLVAAWWRRCGTASTSWTRRPAA